MKSIENSLNLAKSNVLTSIFDTLGFNYSVIDAQGNYIVQNNTAMSTVSEGHVNAERIDPTTWMDCKKVMMQRKRTIKEERFKERYYLSIKQPLYDQSSCLGILIISHDITKQKQAHIAKQAFLQNMAHDIRTPLSGMIGLAQLQKMGLDSPKESKDYGQMIYGAGNQLLELLNAIIYVIDTEEMKDTVKAAPLDLSVLAEEMQALILPSIYTQGLKFQVEVEQDLPLIISDKVKLKRILVNLLSNAVKFTKEGEISLAIKRLGIDNNHAKVEIKVSDTGIGIAEENLANIFERFYRVHPSYLAEYTGYGLGLYLVKETLALLGGTIEVSSEEGKGTCFTLHFKFPLPDQDLDKIGTVLESSSKVHAKIGSVLIAEDNALVLRVVKNLLEKAGYEVMATVDGKAALEALQNYRFAWTLLDIGLPELTGIEVCQQYRQWEKDNNKPYLPIFALTGHGVEEVGEECRESGMDLIFTKPLTDKIIQEIEVFIKKN